MYVSVVVFKKLGEFDDELTYKVPSALTSQCKVGSLVEMSFRNRCSKGVITHISKNLPENLTEDKIKPIAELLSAVFLPPRRIDLARFIANYYRTSMARALRLFLPKLLWNGRLDPPERKVYRLLDGQAVLRGEKQKLALEVLKRHQGEADLEHLKKAIDGFTSTPLKALICKGVVEEVVEPLFPPPAEGQFNFSESQKLLTPDQKEALKQIQQSDKPVLLHGVTGSGKTEIYLRQILETIKQGKQAILLVPEIALTPQTIAYFQDFLGDHIALFHSQLSDGERAREWWKAKSGFAPLVIGSRSAIFAPVENPGLVILDEEHEWTYKQESNPYYQTHRVAEELQRLWGADLILGSATPSAESYQKTRIGDYTYIHLPERIHQSQLPTVRVVDLRDEFKKRNFSIFSLILQKKIKERLAAKEQIILFVNQRGLANAVVCRDCGYTEQCPNCEISLKYHRNYQDTGYSIRHTGVVYKNSKSCMPYAQTGTVAKHDRLVCHYCTFTKEPELLCPECRSSYIKHIGVGTQRVEEEVHQLFPQARAVRADRDTTQHKAGFASIYRDFLEHRYDILIGTQMIAKGLDFGKVSLIGIVLADIGLHLPDFRSSERLFQIITQVAGRCGRRDQLGEVILQTYNPDHPTIKKAANYQFKDFMDTELKQRAQLGYPPFNRMVKFTVVGSDPKKLFDHIQQEQEVLEDIFKVNDLPVKIVSAPALIPKMSNRYYYHVLLRSKDPNIVFKHWKPPRGWRIDVDPIHTT